MRSKIPELQESHGTDLQVRDRDKEMKQKTKDYADSKRNAQESEIEVGDSVLLQQRRQDKLTARFEVDPYPVIDRSGNQITVESPAGVGYKRNISHTKKYQEPEVVTAVVGGGSESLAVAISPLSPESTAHGVATPDTPGVHSVAARHTETTPRRSMRERTVPKRFKTLYCLKLVDSRDQYSE